MQHPRIEFILQHCWWCFCKVKPHAVTPCPHCSRAVYCSAACRAKHRVHSEVPQLCSLPWSWMAPVEGLLAAAMALDAQVRGLSNILPFFTGNCSIIEPNLSMRAHEEIL